MRSGLGGGRGQGGGACIDGARRRPAAPVRGAPMCAQGGCGGCVAVVLLPRAVPRLRPLAMPKTRKRARPRARLPAEVNAGEAFRCLDIDPAAGRRVVVGLW